MQQKPPAQTCTDPWQKMPGFCPSRTNERSNYPCPQIGQSDKAGEGDQSDDLQDRPQHIPELRQIILLTADER
jgi:hypothetical protein